MIVFMYVFLFLLVFSVVFGLVYLTLKSNSQREAAERKAFEEFKIRVRKGLK